jgi:glutaredoxin
MPRAANVETTIAKNIATINRSNKVVVWGLSYCPFCQKAVKRLNDNCIQFALFYVDLSPYVDHYKKVLKRTHKTFPQIIVKNKLLGGYDQLVNVDINALR